MNQAVLEKINDIFGHPEKITPANMENLIHETLAFFNDLRLQLLSTDEKEREEAMNIAMALKNKLEEQAQALCQSIGIDQKALAGFVNDRSHFSDDEWQSMERAKSEMENFQKELGLGAPSTTPARRKSKAVKERLMS
jgi:hypothetical protein